MRTLAVGHHVHNLSSLHQPLAITPSALHSLRHLHPSPASIPSSTLTLLLFPSSPSLHPRFPLLPILVDSQYLWCGEEASPAILLRVLHGEEEVQMAHHNPHQHASPTAVGVKI